MLPNKNKPGLVLEPSDMHCVQDVYETYSRTLGVEDLPECFGGNRSSSMMRADETGNIVLGTYQTEQFLKMGKSTLQHVTANYKALDRQSANLLILSLSDDSNVRNQVENISLELEFAEARLAALASFVTQAETLFSEQSVGHPMNVSP